MIHPDTELRYVNDAIGYGVFATRHIPCGTITWVRDHLDQINERLAGQGLRVISLSDPEHVERYGLQDLARDRNLELEFGLADEADIEDQVDAKVA